MLCSSRSRQGQRVRRFLPVLTCSCVQAGSDTMKAQAQSETYLVHGPCTVAQQLQQSWAASAIPALGACPWSSVARQVSAPAAHRQAYPPGTQIARSVAEALGWDRGQSPGCYSVACTLYFQIYIILSFRFIRDFLNTVNKSKDCH